MQATVKWVDGVMFVGESGSGPSVVMDGAPDQGGRNIGVRHMEMLLVGRGCWASCDVLTRRRQGRQQVADCRVELQAERADAVPAVFSKIHLNFVVSGTDLKETQVKRAVELSAEKYCSASLMLEAAGVDISHSYSLESTD